jgi:hypothetical protein
MTSPQREMVSMIFECCKNLSPTQTHKFIEIVMRRAFKDEHLEINEKFILNRANWGVTGAIGVYKDRELTVAHALTAVYLKHGREVMQQAARAVAIFNVFSP